MSLFNSPVFVSDDEDDDNIVLKSTWRTRHTRPKSLPKTSENTPPLCNDDETSPSLPSPPALSPLCRPSNEAKTLVISPKRTFSVPSKLDDSSSSEEEFTSLLERLKKKNNFIGNSFLPNNSKGTVTA